MTETIMRCDVCRVQVTAGEEFCLDIPIARVEPPVPTTRRLDLCEVCMEGVGQRLVTLLFAGNEDAGREFICSVLRQGGGPHLVREEDAREYRRRAGLR